MTTKANIFTALALIVAVYFATLSDPKTSSITTRRTTAIMPSASEQSIELPNSKAPGLLSHQDSSLAVVITHPWGPLGGNMHNNVVMAAALYFQKLGITTLRFDFVGWQLSWGSYQASQVEEAANLLLNLPQTPQAKTPTKIVLVGYSYGSLLASSASATIDSCVGVVAIAPPWSVKHWLLLFNSGHHLRQAKLKETLPRLFIIGDKDNFTSESAFEKTIETNFPQETTTAAVLPNADHFFHRQEAKVMNVISEWLLKIFPKCDGELKALAREDVYN